MKKIKPGGWLACFVIILTSLFSVRMLAEGDDDPGNISAYGLEDYASPKENPYVDGAGNSLLIDFQNGSFEEPVVSQVTPSGFATFDYSRVPGWYTIPVKESERNHAQARLIELQNSVVYSIIPPDRNQYAELNAELEGRLFQICKTEPGQKVYYQYYHRGLYGTDVMRFYLYETATDDEADSSFYVRDPKIASDFNLTSTTGQQWRQYTGVYTVPAGQEYTVFAFESVSAANNNIKNGNLLDDIRLFYPAFLEVNQTMTTSESSSEGLYAQEGETVTIRLEINNKGECDSSRTVLTDILPAGLELQESTINLVYQDDGGGSESLNVSELVSYNSSSRKLTVKLGKRITDSANSYANGTYSIEQKHSVILTFQAKVTGTGLTAGTQIINQAEITYNDYTFESYNSGQDDDNVSNVCWLHLKTTEVSGMVWIDKNEDGSLGGSERRADGLTVELVDTNGDPVRDIYGNLLTTVTDPNGAYRFTHIPKGIYSVRLAHPGYRTSAVKGAGADDNKAAADPGDLQISSVNPVDMTLLDTVSLYQIELKHQNIAVLPILSITKTAAVSSQPETEGSDSDPVKIGRDQVLTYIIRIRNHGTNTADSIDQITVSDSIPSGLAIDTLHSSMADAITSGQLVKWENISLAAGAEREFRIPVSVDQDTSLKKVIYSNYAEAESGERSETVISNKTWHYSEDNAGLVIKKTIDRPGAQNEEFTYRIDFIEDSLSGAVTDTFYGVISFTGNEKEKSISFLNLRPGLYRVTELESNGNYTLDSGSGKTQDFTLETGRAISGTAAYLNKRKVNTGVSGKFSVINQMADAG